MISTRKLISPGEHLVEYLKEFGITPYRLAKETAVSQTRISDIIKKNRAITADTAIRLGLFFNTTAQFWMNLQTAYDLKVAQQNNTAAYENIKTLTA